MAVPPTHDVQFQAVPLPDARVNKQPPQTHLVNTFSDNEHLYEHLLDHMLDVITIIDDNGLIVYQSRSIESMLGYEPAAMLGIAVISYIHPDDRASVEIAMEKLLSGTLATNQAEFRFRHQNGEYRRIHAVAKVWDRADIHGIMVNSRDITLAHGALEELAKQNELLAKTFSVSKNLLSISLPATGEFIRVNEAWCEAFGYTEEDALGKTADQLGIWGAKENRQRAIADFYRHDLLRDYEVTAYSRTGEEILLVIDAQLLLDADEPQMLMSSRDVTHSRKTERELRQSQKMDAIGQLTGGVAHDFNNLLGVVMGNAELLLTQIADRPAATKHAQQIFEASRQGANLTQQLLAFSRRQTLAPEPVDLALHLQQLKPILQTTVSENTQIQIARDTDLWQCLVDPNQLETAILNLTLNARDAMPGGGILQFQLSNYVADQHGKSVFGNHDLSSISDGEYVALSVTDNGIGMDQEVWSRAFEPFFTTKESGRGTGLGLSMVFGFVQQSGGAVRLDSTAGAGTTLLLLLPRAADEASVAQTTLAQQPAQKQQFKSAQGETILVVEDNEPLRAILVQELSELGYQVLEAAGEADLLSVLARATAVDLLMSDVILQDRKRGPEIAREVRSHFPECAVLLITGYSPEEVLGNSEYPVLKKPFTLAESSKIVHETLAANRSSRQVD